jgi:hypothetical protein
VLVATEADDRPFHRAQRRSRIAPLEVRALPRRPRERARDPFGRPRRGLRGGRGRSRVQLRVWSCSGVTSFRTTHTITTITQTNAMGNSTTTFEGSASDVRSIFAAQDLPPQPNSPNPRTAAWATLLSPEGVVMRAQVWVIASVALEVCT